MNLKLTLIEVVLVLGILTIAFAVLTPRAIHGAVSAQEAAAATALKSGIVPAEVQFQAGGYLADLRHDGKGDYATSTGLGIGRSFPLMSGQITTASGETLNLLAPTYQAATPLISGYQFNDPVSVVSDQERVWAVITKPQDSNQGRRWFAINQAGNIYASLPAVSAYADGVRPNDAALFGRDLCAVPSATRAVPYRR